MLERRDEIYRIRGVGLERRDDTYRIHVGVG